jgi:hypothetical protein
MNGDGGLSGETGQQDIQLAFGFHRLGSFSYF